MKTSEFLRFCASNPPPPKFSGSATDHLDIIGVSSTKRRGSGTVDLDGGWKLFYSGADPSMSAQAGVGILTSPVCQTVCQMGFLWDHGSVC